MDDGRIAAILQTKIPDDRHCIFVAGSSMRGCVEMEQGTFLDITITCSSHPQSREDRQTGLRTDFFLIKRE